LKTILIEVLLHFFARSEGAILSSRAEKPFSQMFLALQLVFQRK